MARHQSRLITDAMLKDAAEAINHASVNLTAEIGTHHGWPCIILTLNDPPSTQLIAHVRDAD